LSNDLVVEGFVDSIANDHLQIVGPELVLGKIYQLFHFPDDGCCNYFRNLVLCSIPCSKLKTIDYFKQHLNIDITIYLSLFDELNTNLKPKIEQLTFEHTRKILKGRIVAFYDKLVL
jgi:hypothetical protein